MLGEIGRLYDVVFIETTQINAPLTSINALTETYDDGTAVAWRGASDGRTDSSVTGTGLTGTPATGPGTLTGTAPNEISPAEPGALQTPGWDQRWPLTYKDGTTDTTEQFEALMLGDNAFGHAISLPVELRDGGVLDFGREHALAWYSIWGFGLVTDSAVVKIRTNP